MPPGLAGQFRSQVGHVAVQAEQLVPHGQAEGDAAGLAAGAAQVQATAAGPSARSSSRSLLL